MSKGKKGKSMDQRNQAMRAESNNAEENIAHEQRPYHKDMHAPNRPSV